MIVIPAIDIRDGRCVQAAAARVRAPGLRSDDPTEVALYWERAGFPRVHVMDLDGGAPGGGRHDAVRELLEDLSIESEVGGDVRSGDQVEQLIEEGASYVILGRRALEEPEWLDGTADAFPGRLIVAMRVTGRQLESRGRTRSRSTLAVIDEFAGLPLAALLLAPDVDGRALDAEELHVLEDAAEASAHPLFVAGGVRTMRDLRALDERGVTGVIAGGALYDGSLDPRLVAEEFSE
jgi:phosphoribosylformimino-5-aminoimidazole carboxamide ribotide isomerase